MQHATLKQQILGASGVGPLPDGVRAAIDSGYPLFTVHRPDWDMRPESLSLSTLMKSPEHGHTLNATLQGWSKWMETIQTLPGDHSLWMNRAQVRALLALVLGRKVELALSWDAYIAGLMLDVGKLSLARLSNANSIPLIRPFEQDTSSALINERDNYGLDHCLAGKWLGEQWELSRACVQAVWLHHHSQDALQYLNYPLRFLQLVQCCDTLSHSRADIPKECRLLLYSLNLDESTVQSLLQEAWTLVEESNAPDLLRSTTIPKMPLPEENTSLELALQQAQQREGLMRDSMQQSPHKILERVIATLVHEYAISSGLIWTIDHGGGLRTCLRWRGEHIEHLQHPDRDQDSPQVTTMLQQLETGTPGETGIHMTPLQHNGATLGYAAFELSGGSAASWHSALQEYLGATALALHLSAEREALVAQEEALVQGLSEQEADLEQARSELRLEGIQQLAGGTAHEINNPLAIISGKAQVLLQKAEDPKVVEGLEAIVKQSRRANKVIVDLMQFARPDPPVMAPIALEQIVHSLLATQQDRLAQHQIQVVEAFEQTLPMVSADRKQIEQVLLQLIQNAERAMKEQGGTLAISLNRSKNGESVVLQCKDTSVGMTQEEMDKVFEPFFTTAIGVGTGMGMAMCKSIIQRHGGTISFQSIHGAGTTCTMTLPTAESHAIPNPLAQPFTDLIVDENAPPQPQLKALPPYTEAEVEAPAKPTTPATRLVLADGDDALRSVLCGALEGMGYTVDTAQDSLEAHALILSHPADALIIEFIEPRTDLLNQIDDMMRRHPDLVIVALLNPGNAEEDIIALRSAGVKTCLRKPFELYQLLRELEHWLPDSAIAEGA